MMKGILGGLALAGAFVLSVPQAGASPLTDAWGLTPYLYADSGNVAGNWNIDGQRTETGTSNLGVGNMTWAEGNDTNNHFGTPSGGEIYDHEFLAWRIDPQTQELKVLGITSLNPYTAAFEMGDLFIDIDCDSYAQDGTVAGNGADANGFEYAISTGIDWSNNLTHNPGGIVDHTGIDGLYLLDEASDVVGIASSGGGWGGSETIRNQSNPLAISQTATNIGGAQVTIESLGISDGGQDNWVIEWVIDLSDLPTLPDLSQLTLHWSMECGNDWLNTDKPTGEPVIPEPATVALLGLGLATAGVMRRQRVSKN